MFGFGKKKSQPEPQPPKTTIQRTDVAVLEYPGTLTATAREALEDRLGEKLGCSVVVLEGGSRMKVFGRNRCGEFTITFTNPVKPTQQSPREMAEVFNSFRKESA